MAAQDDLRTSAIATAGVVSAIIVFAIIILVTVAYQRAASEQEYEKVIAQPPTELGNVIARQEEKLASYGWIDQEKGVVHIPIDRAMGIVVDELSRQREATKETGQENDENEL